MAQKDPETRPCRTCGAPVPHDAPFGHCPSCLIDLGLGSMPDEGPGTTHRTQNFGDYELLSELGRGGMGVVYKARQAPLNRLVALKMLRSHAAAFPDIAANLTREARIVGSLRHPHIVTIYDMGVLQGQPFFTMELVEGSSLDKFIVPDAGFRPESVGPEVAQDRAKRDLAGVRLMLQIARAVDFAHKHMVLHRDLKPANILVDHEGEPRLTDFGLAKVIEKIGDLSVTSGLDGGTAAYMAPEQASGETNAITSAVDVYSVGAIIYEMLTGRTPFRAKTTAEMLHKVVHEAPKHPSAINRDVDGDLATICLKCLEKEPSRRYGSAEALAEDLDRWLRKEPIKARTPGKLERFWWWCRREPALAGLLATVLLLLTIASILGFSLYRAETLRLQTAQIEKLRRVKALFDRIEEEWNRAGQSNVRISAEELAMASDRNLSVDGTEEHVVVGMISRLRKPDEAVDRIAPLVSFLQTNQPAPNTPNRLFDLEIYRARSNAIGGLLEGTIDLMRVDPADYVSLRQAHTNIFPLVRQIHSESPGLHGAIFTMEGSGIRTLADLKGKSFGFADDHTALGEFLPKAQLAKAGIRAGDFLSLTNMRGRDAIEAVRTGALDAGVAAQEDLDNAATIWKTLQQFPNTINAGRTNLIILKPLTCPSHPWLTSTGLDLKASQSIADRLRTFQRFGIVVPFDPKLTGFESTIPSDYDSLAQDMELAKQFDQPR